MSTSAVSGMGLDVDVSSAAGLGPELGLCAGPSTSSSTHPRLPAKHTEVENWDDDFADDSPDSTSAHSDDDDGDGRPLAGPSNLASGRNASTFSPRSVKSSRAVPVQGPDDEEEEDEDEGWDEEDEDDEDGEDESWDEDEDDEVVEGRVGFTSRSAGGPLLLEAQPPISLLPTSPAGALTDASPAPPAGALPGAPPSSTLSSCSSLSPPTTSAPFVLPPSTQASVSSSTSSALSSFQASPSVPPPATSSSSPSSPISTQPSLLPAHISTSTPAHTHTSPQIDDDHDELEFGLKPHLPEHEHGDRDAEHEFEDEDATITARSRHSRAKTRLSTAATAPPLPSVPTTMTTTFFAPPSTSSNPRAVAEHPRVVGGAENMDLDRGEGTSRRAPVFSPPGAHISAPSSATAPSSVVTTVTPATASPSKTPRRTIRPGTADSLQSCALNPTTFDLSSRARGSLDAVRTLQPAVEATDNAKDAVPGLIRMRRYALGGVPESKVRAGMWSRLGQGVSRWAGSSHSTSTSSGPSTSNSTSIANANATNANVNGIGGDRRRGRGRSNTVTGASMLSGAPPLHPPPTTSTPVQTPSVIVGAAPRTSLASGRPSTSSSNRPSTASTASASSSIPGKATLRPRPATNSSGNATTTSQRNSIASLLSIRTYRSRTSSVSASTAASRTPSGSTSGHGSSSGSHPPDSSNPTRQSIDEEEAPPRSSMSSWTQRFFNGSGETRTRQSCESTRPTFGVSVGVGGVGGGRRSMDVIGRQLAVAEPSITEAGRGEEGKGVGGKEGETQTQTKGVLGFFGRRKRSNTVSALSPPPPASNASGPDDNETQTEVYANKKASKSQRSLQVLLGRRPSALGRRESASRRGGRIVAKDEAEEVLEARTNVRAVEVDLERPAAPEHQTERTADHPMRSTKRSIVAGRPSMPLSPPTRSGSEPTVGTQRVRPSPSKHVHTRSQSTSRSTSHSTSHSTSNSLSSIGELKIPSRISQAQVSIRRDLGLVKEFAGKVAELKDLQGSYLKMIESVQGMIDSDNGQPLALIKPSRPRSNTSPALSRPPSKSPLASLFQGPDSSSDVNSTNATPSTLTPVTPATPATSAKPSTQATTSTPSPLATPLCNGPDLIQRMADITARYDSWWECAELLIELGNTPPSVPTPVSTVRLTPPTSIFVAPPTPASPGPPPPTPIATVTAKSIGDTYGALSSGSAASAEPNSLLSSTASSNHVGPTPKPTRGRANTFAGNMPVARLRSASTSTASITHGGHVQSLSTSSSSSSTAPSHTWRATTGRHDLSQRQLVLLREMLGVDQKPQTAAPRRPSAMSVQTRMDDDDELDADSDGEDATWRWGHAITIQLPSPAEEKEAYFGIPTRKTGRRPWNRPYHQSTAPSDDEDHGQEVYVVEPAETKKSKGMNAIRDMLRTLKRAHPPTPTTPTFPMSAEAPPVLSAAPTMPNHAPLAPTHGTGNLSPAQHTIRRAASLLPLSSGPSAHVPSSSSTMSRASKIDPALAFSMTPENIKPLLDNAREVTERLGECVADVRALLASAGVEAVAGDS